MPIDTNCPECHAPHAKKLPLIHSEGLSTVGVVSHAVGTINTIGRAKIAMSGFSSGIQQSELSKSAAPPPVPPLASFGESLKTGMMIFGPIASGLIVLVAAIGFEAFNSFGSLMGTAFGAMILCVVIGLLVDGEPTAQEHAEYKKKYVRELDAIEIWNSTFACTACGNRFVPTELPQESKAAPPRDEVVVAPADAQRIKDLGITFDGQQFVFEQRRYDNYRDAINYAEFAREMGRT